MDMNQPVIMTRLNDRQELTPVELANSLGLTPNEALLLSVLADYVKYANLADRESFAKWLWQIAGASADIEQARRVAARKTVRVA